MPTTTGDSGCAKIILNLYRVYIQYMHTLVVAKKNPLQKIFGYIEY